MPLDPEVRRMLSLRPDLDLKTLTPQEFRRIFREMSKAAPRVPVHRIQDVKVKGSEAEIPVRLYYPSPRSDLGITVYFHGGGFVIGDVEVYDPLCRALSRSCECIVASVDYRLAPEHKFPAAVVDAYDALRWVYQSSSSLGGNGRVAVAGDSAGGNLAAVSAVLARDRGEVSLVHQVLVYPAIAPDWTSRSFVEYGRGYGLSAEEMAWYSEKYLRSPQDALNPLFAPILNKDLSRLPPALILTAQYDPLRDQGEAYGAKLAEAGVPVTVVRFKGVIHGFLGNPYKAGRDALTFMGAVLRDAFYS